MTETSHRTEAESAGPSVDAPPETDSAPDAATAAPVAAPAGKHVRYCPSCRARYVREADVCVSCATPLVDRQPRDVAILRPALDVPFLAALVLFVMYQHLLPGEARSFGLIFLIVGGATLVTFRAIAYAEWLGRR